MRRNGTGLLGGGRDVSDASGESTGCSLCSILRLLRHSRYTASGATSSSPAPANCTPTPTPTHTHTRNAASLNEFFILYFHIFDKNTRVERMQRKRRTGTKHSQCIVQVAFLRVYVILRTGPVRAFLTLLIT